MGRMETRNASKKYYLEGSKEARKAVYKGQV